jgi:AcrR family transcriptional regulator
MEAAASERTLPGEKAARIVDAMRASVAQRGAAGSTFDHVAREAGVSRGLLHYYFGTKERLLVEVVRRDCQLRMTALDEQLAAAETAEDFLSLLVFALEDLIREESRFFTVIFEFFTLSRRNDEIAVEFAELMRRTREHVAAVLAAKQEEGVLRLSGEPEAVADLLFAVGDGMAMRMLAEPDRDWAPTIAVGVAAIRHLLTAP